MPFGIGRKDDVRRYVKGAYHTKISDKSQLAEIEKVADRLEADEEVLLVAKQTKNVLKPGGSMFTPNNIIVTDRKLILRNPSALGLRQKLEMYSYDNIVDVKLERGMLSASLTINVPGSVSDGVIDAIGKDEAEQILRIIQDAIKKIKGMGNQQQIVQSSSIADELAKLAKLKEQDIISEEEFKKMKQDLIDKM
jgi:hypothetical protein